MEAINSSSLSNLEVWPEAPEEPPPLAELLECSLCSRGISGTSVRPEVTFLCARQGACHHKTALTDRLLAATSKPTPGWLAPGTDRSLSPLYTLAHSIAQAFRQSHQSLEVPATTGGNGETSSVGSLELVLPPRFRRGG